MCDRFIRNRERFVNLVRSLDSFDEKEIVEKFRELQNGDLVIDGSQTITEYLDELRESGTLRYTNGKYTVVKEMHSMKAPMFTIDVCASAGV